MGGRIHNRFNVIFDRPVNEIVFNKMVEYQNITHREEKHEQETAEHFYSLVHLTRGIFMSSGSDLKLKIWIPGKS